MSIYRVTMKISFMVNINEENAMSDPRPPLQGDTPEAASNRASWVWLKGMGLAANLRKSLGVGRSFTRNADMVVERMEEPQEPDRSEVPE